jgi:hypothetical protein
MSKLEQEALDRMVKLELELQQAREEIVEKNDLIENLNEAHDSMNRTCNNLRQQLAQCQVDLREKQHFLDQSYIQEKVICDSLKAEEKRNDSLQRRLDEAAGLIEECTRRLNDAKPD